MFRSTEIGVKRGAIPPVEINKERRTKRLKSKWFPTILIQLLLGRVANSDPSRVVTYLADAPRPQCLSEIHLGIEITPGRRVQAFGLRSSVNRVISRSHPRQRLRQFDRRISDFSKLCFRVEQPPVPGTSDNELSVLGSTVLP